ncbi:MULTISPECIES: phosphotransferase [unclassified Aureimonas]|uniref:phosphotransferase n=1 Tax=unclassified Aureimonas TaxID=2615206 RepID=UPI0006FD8A9A|nr:MULTISPECIES: phosphotransferase [unclassified Aureimonas]KQT52495.1 aminoglycoside phosphotransferase [Aureimonas sp. Leaf427]KQT77604.1 aminoglycoside phosphotransferase [Aureimonas sp. Leaf460]
MPASLPDTPERLAIAALAGARDLVGERPRLEIAVEGAASPSYHGVESASFLVTAEGGEEPAFFLKVGEPALSGLLDAGHAFRAASAIADLGLAPRPLRLAAEEGAILFERLGPEWRPATLDLLSRRDSLAAVIGAFAKVAGGARFGRPASVFEGIADMRALLGPDAATLPPDAWWLFEEVAAIEAAFEAAGSEIRPLHNDPHASNLLFGPGGALRLVDFDRAGDGDPHQQLGALLNEAFQFEDDMRLGVEIAEGAFRPAVFNRCRAYAAADDLYWGLRALVLDRLSPRTGLEFRKYAGWRFLRCRMLLNRPGFEETLRKLG